MAPASGDLPAPQQVFAQESELWAFCQSENVPCAYQSYLRRCGTAAPHHEEAINKMQELKREMIVAHGLAAARLDRLEEAGAITATEMVALAQESASDYAPFIATYVTDAWPRVDLKAIGSGPRPSPWQNVLGETTLHSVAENALLLMGPAGIAAALPLTRSPVEQDQAGAMAVIARLRPPSDETVAILSSAFTDSSDLVRSAALGFYAFTDSLLSRRLADGEFPQLRDALLAGATAGAANVQVGTMRALADNYRNPQTEQVILDGLRSSEIQVRAAAASCIRGFPSETASDLLLHSVQAEGAAVASPAAATLGAWHDRRLLDLLSQDPAPGTKDWHYDALFSIRVDHWILDQADRERLLCFCLQLLDLQLAGGAAGEEGFTRNSNLCNMAADLIAESGDMRALPALLKGLRHPNYYVRLSILDLLAQFPASDVNPDLRRIAATDTNELVKSKARKLVEARPDER